MRIHRAQGLESAASARGGVVVIDVLRAFTTAAYALASGAREIWLVATPEEALFLRAARPDLVLAGEVGGRPIAGFDHGNSPERMRELDLADRTLVLRSSSGVQGALQATRAERVFLGSLVTASATARALLALGREVTLLAMGSPQGPDGPEDDACADLLEDLLRRRPADAERVRRAVAESPAGRMALDPAIDWVTPGDLECALEVDRFDFAIAAERHGERLIARAYST